MCEACGTFDKPALTAGQDEELDVGDFEEQMIMNALSATSVVGNTFVHFTKILSLDEFNSQLFIK